MDLRKKFYFVDYTDKILVAKRILNILYKKTRKGKYAFSLGELVRYLRWGAGVFNKKRKSTAGLDAKLFSILRALDILSQVRLLSLKNLFTRNVNSLHIIENILNKSHHDKLNFAFKIIDISEPSLFFEVINSSEFSPIQGKKQVLTKDVRQKFYEDLKIDYQKHLNAVKEKNLTDYTNNMILLSEILESKWSARYEKMCGIPVKNNIDVYKHINFITIFDSAYERAENSNILSDGFIEDRTVGCYGFSVKSNKGRSRNDYYMRYDESQKWSDKETDRGHFLAHSIGGDILTNIFPQKRDINRGRSKKGKEYRKMGKYLENNAGVFCFASPIYFDFSTRPFILEFGYITKDYQIRVGYFENV